MKASTNSLSRVALTAVFAMAVLFAGASLSRPTYADHIPNDPGLLNAGHEFDGKLDVEHIVALEDFNRFSFDDSDWIYDSNFDKTCFAKGKKYDGDRDDKECKLDYDGTEGDGAGSWGGNGVGTNSVPEPSSMVLLSAALFGLAAAARKRLFS